jgi:hypothetical protein
MSIFCHSGLDPESSIFNHFYDPWIPACAGMTKLFAGITTFLQVYYDEKSFEFTNVLMS